MDSNIQNLKPRNTRLIFSLLGIIYVWSLPLLADIGFAQKNATSISGFIANPPATGGMAFVSFSPLVLIGIISFAGLLFADDMWIWGLECVSFTCMLLFTVLEWVYLKPRGTLGDSVELSSEINPLE